MSKLEINDLLKMIKDLRDPLKGCPWDQKQTLETIISYSIEEVYEVAQEIYNKNYNGIEEELGDLLFQVIYLSQIAKEKKKFDFSDVVNATKKKIIYRNPHVFKNKKFKDLKDLNIWWKKSKKRKKYGLLDHIPNSYPAMLKANKIQNRLSLISL